MENDTIFIGSFRNFQLMRKTILKLFFPSNHRYSERMLKQVFWIVYKSWSYFQFLVQSLQVTRDVRGNIKMHCIYLHLKLNLNLYETDLSEGLNLFREIILQDSSLHILKFVFWNNLPGIYLSVGIAYKNTLHSYSIFPFWTRDPHFPFPQIMLSTPAKKALHDWLPLCK